MVAFCFLPPSGASIIACKKRFDSPSGWDYPDVQAFKRTYDTATALVEQYNRDLAAWERQVSGEKQPQQVPPEKESIRKKLQDMEAEAKRRNAERRQEPRHRSYDYDRGR